MQGRLFRPIEGVARILSMVQTFDASKVWSLTMCAESGPVGNSMFPKAQAYLFDAPKCNGTPEGPIPLHYNISPTIVGW